MNRTRLLLRNLVFHWRGNLAVLLGVAVGAMVLTGALLVGDSLRGSLRELALRRLGWVDAALVAPRFFRAALADELTTSAAGRHFAPAILLQATAIQHGDPGMPTSQPPRYARRVLVVGVDERFWNGWDRAVDLSEDPRRERQFGDRAWLNSGLARALDASPQRPITLRMQKPAATPRETPFGRRDIDSVLDEWTIEVGNILRAGEPGDAFNLRPELETPRLAFVPLRLLQARLGMEGKANALLVAGPAPDLAEVLHRHLTLDDWGLSITGALDRVRILFEKLDRNRDDQLQPREWRDRFPEKVAREIAPENTTLTREEFDRYYFANRLYINVESANLLLEPAIAEAALKAARGNGDRPLYHAAPTLVYLANTIRSGGKEIPYSVVAAVEPGIAPAPAGPVLNAGVRELADDEILLAGWDDSPLRDAKIGDEVELVYFNPEQHGTPTETTAKFRLAGFLPLDRSNTDTDITPEFPGITDKLSIGEWDPPFPYDNRRIKPIDDRYWKEFRTRPKAYVTLKRGQELWGSRFGKLTSIRLTPNLKVAWGSEEEPLQTYRKLVLRHLSPEKAGLVFDPVREQALAASVGGTDFAGLFLGFSFFLIAAALLLVGLLFRLNLDRRASEIGLLLATGYPQSTVRRLLLQEGLAISVVGVLVGLAAATLYAGGLLEFLALIWPGGELRTLLQPHFTVRSLVLGAGAALAVTLGTIAWAVRVLGRIQPPALLAGQTTTATAVAGPATSRSIWIALVALGGAAGLQVIGTRATGHEAQAGSFFGSGALLLTAALALLWRWMSRTRIHTLETGLGVGRLGVRNAARFPTRSLLTAGLLASAAFLLVAVEAFRRHADVSSTGPDSGLGGFTLLAESDLPIYLDFNSAAGRAEIRDRLVLRYRDLMSGDNEAAQERAQAALVALRETTIVPLRVRAGDDASCLNLYQPRRPRLLGVPNSLIERGGFHFAASAAVSSEENANPWRILQRPGDEIPVFGENNTVLWMLGKALGGTVEAADGRGEKQSLRIAGLLTDSVFQSGLLMSEQRFLQLFPEEEGFTFFLIEPPAGRECEIKEILDMALAERGFETSFAAERLEMYLAVENTYLSTFQALGGLGLMLGSLGLAVVLLRGVWERRGELALLRALGWRRGMLGWLVLAENGALLLIGLAAGTTSALLAVAPHLTQTVGVPPWLHLLALLAAVFAVGLFAGALAVAATLQAPLVPALRKE